MESFRNRDGLRSTSHLGECDACSTRRAAIASAASATSVDYRATSTAGPLAEHIRARLEIALARVARGPRSPAASRSAPAIAVAAVAVLIASATIYLQSAPDTDSLAARHRLGAARGVAHARRSVGCECGGVVFGHDSYAADHDRDASRGLERVRCPERDRPISTSSTT